MKQFQIQYQKERGLQSWLGQIRNYCDENHVRPDAVLFRVYADVTDMTLTEPVIARLRSVFPDALYTGVSTSGNITRGSLVPTHISMTCTIFEEEDSRALVMQVPMTAETQKQAAQTLLEAVRQNPWVRAVEIITTLSHVNIPVFCREISELPEDILIFGGGANGNDLAGRGTEQAYVFSSDGEQACFSAVFLLMGGSSLHIYARYLTGWNRLGRKLEITGFKDNNLISLDGRPAAEVYHKYLKIPMDEHFFRVANVFPLSFESNGDSYLRVVASHHEGGVLRLAAPVLDTHACYITYGNSGSILQSIKECLADMQEFSPQMILLFSCAARKYYWGSGNVSTETLPFESLAPVSGFYTSGELMRSGRNVLLHNITLVTVGFREGDIPESRKAFQYEETAVSHQILIGNCLASFVNAMTEELLTDPHATRK